jgi:hypothetical protein
VKKLIFSCLVIAITIGAANLIALAQKESAAGIDVEQDILLLRRDLRGDKKQLIALNLPLTETEATQFWPVYDQYAADMGKRNDAFYALIKDYVANQKTLTDDQAAAMLKRWAELQLEAAQIRQKYISLVEKVISPRKAALFFQVDRRLYAMMDLQTSAQLPLLIQ